MTRGTFSGNCSVASATTRLDLPVPGSPITTTRTPDLPARFAEAAGDVAPAMPRASLSPPLPLSWPLGLGFWEIWALVRRRLSAGGVRRVGWSCSYWGTQRLLRLGGDEKENGRKMKRQRMVGLVAMASSGCKGGVCMGSSFME